MNNPKRARNRAAMLDKALVKLAREMWTVRRYCERCGKPVLGMDERLFRVPDGVCFDCHLEDVFGPEEDRDRLWGPEVPLEEYTPKTLLGKIARMRRFSDGQDTTL